MSGTEAADRKGGIVTHFAWSALRTWGERITSLLVFVLLSRLLRPEDIGALSYVGAFLFFAQTLAEGSFAEWIVRQKTTSREEESSIFWMQVLLGAIVATALLIGGLLFGRAMLQRDDAFEIVAALTVVIPLVCMERVPEAMLRRTFRFDRLAIRTLVVSIFGGAVGIGLALLGFGIWSLVIKQIVEVTGRVVLVFWLSGWWPRPVLHPSLCRNALSFGGAVLGSRILDAINQRVDVIIVGSLLGPVALGFYSVAIRIQQLIAELFNGMIYSVAFQHFAECAGDPVRTRALHLRLLGGTSRYTIPLIALIAATAPLHIPLLFGDKWLPIVPSMQFLCLLPMMGVLVVYSNCILLANNAKRDAMLLSLYGLALTAVLTTTGSWFGILGVSILLPLRGLFLMVLGARLVFPFSQVCFSDYVQSIYLGVIAAIVGSAVVFLAEWILPPELPRLVVVVLAPSGGVIAIVAVLLFALGKKAFEIGPLRGRN